MITVLTSRPYVSPSRTVVEEIIQGSKCAQSHVDKSRWPRCLRSLKLTSGLHKIVCIDIFYIYTWKYLWSMHIYLYIFKYAKG